MIEDERRRRTTQRAANDPPQSSPGRQAMQAAFGDTIRAAARRLRSQYPNADVDFIVHCLEYDLGLRGSVIRKVLADGEADSGGGTARKREPQE